MSEVTVLKVAQIEESRSVRVRDRLNKDAVQQYADLYASSGQDALPALDIFQERGCKRWIVADGRHRFAAAKKAGLEKLPCKLHEGDDIAALDFAVACNVLHGVRRTDDDIGVILRSIFNTPELGGKEAGKYRTDEELSDKVGVSTKTIQRHRARWRDEPGGNKPAKSKDRTRAAKHTPAAPKIVTPRPASQKTPELDIMSSSPKTPNGAPTTPPKKPPTGEQKKVAAQVKQSVSRAGEAPKLAPLAHDKVHNLQHGAGLVSACDLDPERVANESGISKETWKRVRDFASDVLEHL